MLLAETLESIGASGATAGLLVAILELIKRRGGQGNGQSDIDIDLPSRRDPTDATREYVDRELNHRAELHMRDVRELSKEVQRLSECVAAIDDRSDETRDLARRAVAICERIEKAGS